MATTSSDEKQVMIVAVDDSEHSSYALQWTLDHFFTTFPNPIFKLVLLHAKPFATFAVGLAGPGAAEVFPIVDFDLRKIAARVVDNAKQICSKRSVTDVITEVVEGDPRNVFWDAGEKYHASILVGGSHGYGAIKRAVLGSVRDYCAHHAHCTVMIVKRPKTKH
uniref:Universal stress protein n=1 Tax=Arachis diogoi TaxID=170720 RepID=A0A0K0K9R9_9FABA|nr:universal stress protein [Arachis diogoi]